MAMEKEAGEAPKVRKEIPAPKEGGKDPRKEITTSRAGRKEITASKARRKEAKARVEKERTLMQPQLSRRRGRYCAIMSSDSERVTLLVANLATRLRISTPKVIFGRILSMKETIPLYLLHLRHCLKASSTSRTSRLRRATLTHSSSRSRIFSSSHLLYLNLSSKPVSSHRAHLQQRPIRHGMSQEDSKIVAMAISFSYAIQLLMRYEWEVPRHLQIRQHPQVYGWPLSRPQLMVTQVSL